MTAVFMILVIVAMVYALLVMPRVTMRPDMRSLLTEYAHRGFYDNAAGVPENSLLAFEGAVEREYGIELDLQLTSDGKVVVFHDYTLKRMCGEEVKLSSLTYDELKKYRLLGTDCYIPTFEEVLELVDGRVPLLAELKGESGDDRLCSAAAELLDRYSGVYCVESFNPLLLRWFKKNRPDIVRGQLVTNLVKSKSKGNIFRNIVLSGLLANFLSRPDFIAADKKYLRDFSIRICTSLFGVPLFVWTVKKREHLTINRENRDFSIFEGFEP